MVTSRLAVTQVLIVILCAIGSVTAESPARRDNEFVDDAVHVGADSRKWAVRFASGNDYSYSERADRFASELNLENLGQVGRLVDTYLFRSKHERHTRDLENLQARLAAHSSAYAVYEQRALVRTRRSPPSLRSSSRAKVDLRWRGNHVAVPAQQKFKIHHESQAAVTDSANSTENGNLEPLFNDPLFPKQWYLCQGSQGTLNVQPVWARNVTGYGVVVSVLDDGLEHTHPDLQRCYDARASLDINGQDKDPMPDTSRPINSHGTRCAGEIAAQPNNSICTAGIAFNAKVGGVRLLDGVVTDADEAAAFGVGLHHVDIYTSSWGPTDDGGTVEGPGPLAQAALLHGITAGRRGKGAIYVFAGGNGGTSDDCNCDGYVNSPYTIAIGAVLRDESSPYYAELCAAQLASAFGADTSSGDGVPTTDIKDGCTDEHEGTSASAPQAAAIFALVLEQNPELTWRDLQYLVLVSARPVSLGDTTWFANGLGRLVSYKYGYGVLDAAALVQLASEWTNLGRQLELEVQAQLPLIGMVVDEYDGLSRSVLVAANHTAMRYVEQVQVFVNLSSTYRGEMSVALVSPMGTRSVLLAGRPFDESSVPFVDWGFTTVQLFGETALGRWRLELTDTNPNGFTGTLYGWRLHLRGTRRLCEHALCKGPAYNLTELGWTQAPAAAWDSAVAPVHPRPFGESAFQVGTAPAMAPAASTDVPYPSEATAPTVAWALVSATTLLCMTLLRH